ncbi:MAG TPA: hypothetical protein P5307_27020 [Pirellulaceae bacterium]|nr:hypothetical protein [Planctomycetales bacterium]MCB9936787.1 hypothetical protein [Planctomycetaceae bacterium]HRX82759.1 hypothetical protein [Pirellulaceae bacterium]
MTTRFPLIAVGIGTLLCAAVAQAHPGHGEPGDDFGLTHYLTEPLHIGVGLGLLVAAVCVSRLIWKSISGRLEQNSAA